MELNELLHDNRIKALEEGHNMLNQKLEQSHERLESKFDKVALAIDGINNSLNQFLILNKQAADFEKYCDEKDDNDERIKEKLYEHDTKLTMLVETRNWVLIGIGLILSTVIVAIAALVIK
jgi:hypothetical protein